MKFNEVGKGTYAAVKFSDTTLDFLEELQNKLQLFDPVPRDKLHSTICFSRVKINYMPITEKMPIGTPAALGVFEHNNKRALVLILDSSYLNMRHEYAMILGATYDFPEYKPHITLSYDIGALKILDTALDKSKVLEMASEYVEDLDLDWSPKK